PREETILKTNLEAVKEIAFQLRLRNIGGIIIIDFIDMKENANREKVYSSLVEELKKDRATPIVLPMSEFGLVEMTRKRVKESLIDVMTSRCSYCEGKGYHKSKEMIALEILRRLIRDLKGQRMKTVNVYAHPKVAEILLYEHRTAIEELEYEYNATIKFQNRDDLHFEQFYISS
ncbi:MAG: ribonuclease E/G, partial [Deltaproteobacteria bacterium]|nr:ribonuclease E/G [Deltaproteobacteria bacterium]